MTGKMNKKNWLIIIVSLLFIFVYTWFFRLPFLDINPIEAIPQEASVFFHLQNQPFEKENLTFFKETVEKDSIFFEKIFEQDLLSQDSVKQTLAIAWFPDEDNSWNSLYIFDNSSTINCESLKDSATTAKVKTNYFSGRKIFTLVTGESEASCSCFRNLVFVSRYSFFIEDAIRTLDESANNLLNNPAFRKVQSKGAARKSGSWYVRPGDIGKRAQSQILSLLFPPAGPAELLRASVIPDTTTSLHFRGYMHPGPHLQVKGLLDPAFSVKDILPDNTVSLLLWRTNISSFSQNEVFEKHFLPWMDGEIGIGRTEAFNLNSLDELYFLLKIKDPELATVHLRELEAEGESEAIKYQAFTFHRIIWNEWAVSIFGKEAPNLQSLYYTIIGDYVLFIPDKIHLETFIDKYVSGQTLGQQPHFLQLYEKTASEASAFLYLDAGQLAGKGKVANEMGNKSLLSSGRFSKAVFGFRKEKSKWTVDAILVQKKEGPSVKPEISVAWKTRLNKIAAAAPQVIKSDEDGETHILVQDKGNTLYALNANGKILWEKQLDSKMLSKIEAVNIYQNQEKQYLFNTSNQIFLIDRSGENIGTFPIRLQTPATNGLTVVDFEKTGEYYFFLSCNNGGIYGFDIKGAPLSGWNPLGEAGIIRFPLLHFQKDGKDYLAALTESGAFKMYDQEGKKYLNPVQLPGKFESGPSFQAHDQFTRIVTCNSNGTITVINREGNFFHLKPWGETNEKVRLSFADFTGDARYDYALITDRKLEVFYYDEKDNFRAWQRTTFNVEQDEVFPVSIHPGAHNWVGTSSSRSKKIFLFDNKGKIFPGFPLGGSTPFVATDLSGSGHTIILTCLDDAVYAYRIR